MSKNVHFQTSQLDSTAVLDFLKAVLSLTKKMERARGIEPPYEAWEAPILPLNYARS